MKLTTTYTLKALKRSDIWEFKYFPDGTLESFRILEGRLGDKQTAFLFSKKHFPYHEAQMITWKNDFSKYFKIEVGEIDLSFDNFYNRYGKKTTKKQSLELWKKMNESDKIKALSSISRYNTFIKLNPRDKVDPVRYLKHRRYDDEFTT